MTKNLLAILIIALGFQNLYGQTSSMGIGLGLEYGGIGVNGTFISESGFGGFIGAGYVFAGVGFNLGIQYSIGNKSKTHPFIHAMYGYNAAIVVKDAFSGSNSFSKIYYGPSIGGGVNILNRKDNIWRISISVPIRDSQFQEDLDDLKSSGVTFNEPLPITIGLGYNFRI